MLVDVTCFNWIQLIKKSDLPANAKYIALYLSTFMNMEHQVAWPSVARISYETGLGESTVQKWTSYLHDQGWLFKRTNRRQVSTIGGAQKNNEYEIRIPASVIEGVQHIDPLGAKGVHQIDKGGPDNEQKGVHQIDPNNNNNNNRSNNRERRTKFAPPTVEEVKAYCQSRKNDIDPQRFVDFYKAKGWKIGKEKMADWRAAVRTWEAREPKREAPRSREFPGV